MANPMTADRTRLVATILVVTLVVAAGILLTEMEARPAVFTPFDGGFGTEASPWEISSADQLLDIDSSDRYRAGHYVLVDDVDWADADESGFSGIGSSEQPFTGELRGDGHAIRDLAVNPAGERRAALFRYSEGVVEDLELVDVEVEADETTMVAGLVATNHGTVADVRVEGTVRGQYTVGLVVGYNAVDSTVVEATAAGRVAGYQNVGGMVGTNWGEVREATAEVDVEGSRLVGGLVGLNHGSVVDGEATRQVAGDEQVGGLVGKTGGDRDDTAAGTVERGRATGNVDGRERVGGLVGSVVMADVVAGEADGEVTGTQSVGGLVGAIQDGGDVVAGRARGDVSGTRLVGGLGGFHGGDIADSLATGAVDGDSQVGGFVGKQFFGATVARSYALGAVRGTEQTGGFAGEASEPELVEDAYWNVDTSGLETSAVGTGLTADEFSRAESFAGFSFCRGEDCRWEMDE